MKTRAKFRAALLMLLVTVFFTHASARSTVVKVMTYNVDEGTDFDAIVSVLSNRNATTDDFAAAIMQTIDEVVSTNPSPARATDREDDCPIWSGCKRPPSGRSGTSDSIFCR